tara:strand:- start:529 stop:942 length:414 start_codon:yes stop_codon:yes gene_type:complete
MKLNGHFYLKEQTVSNELNTIIVLLTKNDGYTKIYSGFKSYVKETHVKKVARTLTEFQEKLCEKFKKDKFIKLSEIIRISQDQKHDPSKESVKLYSQGAYGTIINADVSSVERYVFNKCIDYLCNILTNAYGTNKTN